MFPPPIIGKVYQSDTMYFIPMLNNKGFYSGYTYYMGKYLWHRILMSAVTPGMIELTDEQANNIDINLKKLKLESL